RVKGRTKGGPLRSNIVIAGVVVTGWSFLAGCGATDVERSSEYIELRDERDELATELDEVRAELDDLDDQLAVAADARAEAEEQVAAGEVLTTDLKDVLVLDVMNRVGLNRDDSECVIEAFVADDAIRRSYLLLIDPDNTDAGAAEAAFGDVTSVFSDCGLDVASPPDTIPPAEAQAALAAVIGEVEVVGDPLPQFADGVADTAIGTAAPVVLGADYAGNEVRVDAAANGPT